MELDARSDAVDRSWHAPALCPEGYWRVRAAGGRLVAGTACGAGRCAVALDPADGHAVPGWSARVAAIGEVGCVEDMEISGAAVFFTGGFTTVGGVARDGVAAVRAADGHLIGGFAPRGACAGVEHAIVVAPPLAFVGGDGCPVAAFALSNGERRWAWRRHGNATSAALLVHAGRLDARDRYRPADPELAPAAARRGPAPQPVRRPDPDRRRLNVQKRGQAPVLQGAASGRRVGRFRLLVDLPVRRVCGAAMSTLRGRRRLKGRK